MSNFKIEYASSVRKNSFYLFYDKVVYQVFEYKLGGQQNLFYMQIRELSKMGSFYIQDPDDYWHSGTSVEPQFRLSTKQMLRGLLFSYYFVKKFSFFFFFIDWLFDFFLF